MPELYFLLSLATLIIIYRWVMKKGPFRLVFAATAALILSGHLMNLVVIRANDGQMPVILKGIDWDDAPNIPLPGIIADLFLDTLDSAQKRISGKDKVHHLVPDNEVGRVRLAFLADKYPLVIAGKRTFVYSLGDVFITIGVIFFVFGSFAVWLFTRKRKKTETQ